MERAAGCLFGWIPRALIGALENRPQPVEPPVVEDEQPRSLTHEQRSDRLALWLMSLFFGLVFLAGFVVGRAI